MERENEGKRIKKRDREEGQWLRHKFKITHRYNDSIYVGQVVSNFINNNVMSSYFLKI